MSSLSYSIQLITVLLFTHHQHTTSELLLRRQTSVNAASPSSDGASISHNPRSTTISGSIYNVTVQSQDEYDLRLSLSSEWGFDSVAESVLWLTINGSTPDPASYDTDFLILFASGDTEYFSFFVHLDSLKIRTKIYPQRALGAKPSVFEWISDLNTHRERWDRLCDGTDWINTDPRYNKQSQFPLRFQLSNNPTPNHCDFEFFDYGEFSASKTGNRFNGIFTASQEMTVYIMGDTGGSNAEQFEIHSIDIQLFTQSTLSVDPSPNIDVIESPTSVPSLEPSLS